MNRTNGFTLIELLIVVAIIGIIAAIAIPSLLNALDRTRQTATVDRIRKLGEYVEQYIIDNNNVGCPKVGNDIMALQTLFEETEINLNMSATIDGWNQLILIDMDAAMAGRLYTIFSYGSDSAVGPAPATPGIVKRFTEDIIWVSGIFTQRPEGAQKSK